VKDGNVNEMVQKCSENCPKGALSMRSWVELFLGENNVGDVNRGQEEVATFMV